MRWFCRGSAVFPGIEEDVGTGVEKVPFAALPRVLSLAIRVETGQFPRRVLMRCPHPRRTWDTAGLFFSIAQC